MAQNLPSAEYRALVSCTYKLVIGIAMAPKMVGVKLFAKKLIAHIPEAGQKDQEIATELVRQVTNKVMTFPQRFEDFLAILSGIPALGDLAQLLAKELEEIKMEDSEAIKSKSASPEATPYSSDSDDEATSPQDRFPYLNSEIISEKERERLKVKLESESEEMKTKFAILVDRVRESLERQQKSSSDLKVLVQTLRNNRLIKLIRKCKEMQDLFLKLADYWTFFDYEFLKVIIQRYCPELTTKLTKYESSLKKYCKRRLCEVPADVFTSMGDKYNLYVKIDCEFNALTLEDSKKLEYRLSCLLDTGLHLLEVKDGCTELMFDSLCDITTPLTPEQTRPLKELGVICVYRKNGDKEEEYFNNSTLSQPHTPEQRERLELEDIILPWDEVNPLSQKSPSKGEVKCSRCTSEGFPPQKKLRVSPRKRKHFPHTSEEEDSSPALKKPRKNKHLLPSSLDDVPRTKKSKQQRMYQRARVK